MTYKTISEILSKAVLIYIPLSLLIPIMLYQLRDNNRLIVMDSANTYHISEYSDKEQVKRMYGFVARQAIIAFLMRNPVGVDNQELFDELYVGNAKQFAVAQIEKEAKQFFDYRMHQKAEILRVEILQADKRRSYVEVTGQLLRVFFLDDEKMTLAATFKASMELSLNFDLANNAKFPFKVTELKYEQSEITEKKEKK